MPRHLPGARALRVAWDLFFGLWLRLASWNPFHFWEKIVRSGVLRDGAESAWGQAEDATKTLVKLCGIGKD